MKIVPQVRSGVRKKSDVRALRKQASGMMSSGATSQRTARKRRVASSPGARAPEDFFSKECPRNCRMDSSCSESKLDGLKFSESNHRAKPHWLGESTELCFSARNEMSSAFPAHGGGCRSFGFIGRRR